MTNVFAFAETRAGKLRTVALEAVTAARAIADATGGEVHALVAGSSGTEAHAAALGKAGADVVLLVEHAAFAQYNAEAISAAVAERIKGGGYRAAIFSASAQGRDLAPRVAAKLGAPLVTDVLSAEVSGEALVVKHPSYAGKVMTTQELQGAPVLVSFRPGAVHAGESGKAGRVEKIAPVSDPAAARVVVTELVEGNRGKIDLGEAKIIVAGGRGLRSADNFKLVEELADAFGNAAVGATRAVTDDGWRPHSDQIGQTGRLVSPDLYVAVGISGAIQHLAGMRTSRTIVAINKHKEAPIFKVADYGIVGDVMEVVPALTAAVREARQGR